MWCKNALTERLGLQWPILQAPMSDKTTPSLAAAVSNAGALGGLGMSGLRPENVRRRIEGFRQQSGGSLNVNYLLWQTPDELSRLALPMRHALQELYYSNQLGEVPEPTSSSSHMDQDHLDVLLELKPEVVSFHFGLPERDALQQLKSLGAMIVCSATTVSEAVSLEAEGADVIIAQGSEAGGHRGTFSGVDIAMQPGLFALLPQVTAAVSVPVIAAGGIANGQGIAAALMLGASAVQLGTAFLRCSEANVADEHRAALAAATDSSTVVTDVVSGKPARYLRNTLIQALSAEEPLPFPAQLRLTAPLAETGDPQLMALYAGQAAALTVDKPAGELVQKLAVDTEACFKKFSADK